MSRIMWGDGKKDHVLQLEIPNLKLNASTIVVSTSTQLSQLYSINVSDR